MAEGTARPVAFITGASSGFGEACARRFAAAGYALVLAARRGDRLAAIAASLDVPAETVALDVRDGDAVMDTVAALRPPFDAIDVLVNNAGVGIGLTPSHRADPGDWEATIDTNVKGFAWVARAVLPGMVARDRGHVVTIGSPAARYPYPGGNVYGATKAFVRQFSMNLRADLLGTRVRVTLIEPGLARTEFFATRFKGDQARAESLFDGLEPLTADDVADAVHWCVTRPARVNVNIIELMPVAQAFAPLAVNRVDRAAPDSD